jgi:hypothetical protein
MYATNNVIKRIESPTARCAEEADLGVRKGSRIFPYPTAIMNT